jgi:hypothetical protein
MALRNGRINKFLTIVRRDLGNVLVAERVRDPPQFGLNVIGRAFGQLGQPLFLVRRHVGRDRIIRSNVAAALLLEGYGRIVTSGQIISGLSVCRSMDGVAGSIPAPPTT